MAKAKGKKSSDKTSKSNKGTGAKLAKSVQKSGLMDLINSNLGREILADALIAAAGAAAAALTKTRTAQKAGAAAVDAGSKATDATTDLVQTASGAVANVVTEAARQILPASLLGEEDQGKDKGRAIPRGKKVQYAHLSSDHSKRKTSRKPKDDKAEKH
jgi:secreted PhoX family phosphatase